MKRFGIIIGVAVSVLIGATILVPFLIDWNRFKPMITTAASEALGRELTIDGDLRVSLTPPVSMTVSQIRLANAPRMAGPRMATIERVDASLRLLPLLSGRLVLDRLEVINPEINLEIGADGEPNWRFEPRPGPGPEPRPPAGRGLPVHAIALDGIELRGGRIGLIDHRSGRTLELRDLSLSAAATAQGTTLPDLVASLSGKAEIAFAELRLPPDPARQLKDARAVIQLPPEGGAASVAFDAIAMRGNGDGLPLSIALRTSPLAKLLADGPVPLEAKGKLGNVKVDITGRISGLAGEPLQELTVALESDSLAALNRLLVTELPDLRPVALHTQLTLGRQHYQLAGLSARLGDSDLSGDLDVRLDGERPSVKGKLTSSRLDLVQARQTGAKTTPERAATSTESHVIPDAPLPLDLLREVDADLMVLVGKLRLDDDLVLEDVHLPLVLEAGRLESKGIQAGLRGGRLQGRLAIDAAPEVPSVEVALDARRVAIKGLLGRIALFEPRDATAQVSLDIRGAGRSPRALAASASGRAELAAEGGVLNLGAARLLTIGIADILRPLLGGSSETEMQCLLIRYRLQNGVANSDAQVLSTNAFAVLGAGRVDLRTERIELHFATQSHSPSLMSLAVPFQVSGTLRHPKAGPDAKESVVSLLNVAGTIIDPIYALSLLVPGQEARAGQSPCSAALEQAKSGPGAIAEEAAGLAAGVATGVVEGVGDALEGVGGALENLLGR